LSLALLATLPALAAPSAAKAHATLGPTETLKARDAEIRAVLPPSGQAPSPEINQKIEDAVLKAVDIEGMAKDALGKNWATQPSRKRKKFIEAFRGRFKQATGQQLDLYRSAQTKYVSEEKVGDDVKVTTELTVKGEPTRVGYVMRKEKTVWRIVDIIVDGVSTIDNYRSTFNKVIAKEGFDGLISRLSNAGADEEQGGAKGKDSSPGGAGH